MILPLLGAVCASLAYGTATILQALGVRRMSALPPGAPLATRVISGRLYAAGLGLDGLGFLASAAALRALPLFLVQSLIASSVAVTALLSTRVLGVVLRRRDIVALAAVGLGLVVLAGAAKEGPTHAVGSGFSRTVLALALPVAALMGFGYATRNSTALALAAGLGFCGVGIAARVLAWDGSLLHALQSATVWAIAAHGALATLAYGLALDAGAVNSVAAITFATETLVPAGIGVAFLGDAFRPHGAVPAIVGFALTLAGCIALSGHSEPKA